MSRLMPPDHPPTAEIEKRDAMKEPGSVPAYSVLLPKYLLIAPRERALAGRVGIGSIYDAHARGHRLHVATARGWHSARTPYLYGPAHVSAPR